MGAQLIDYTEERPNDRSLVGFSGAVCQVIGTLFYSQVLSFVPFFNFFPQLIGSLFFMASGILWTAELLLQDLPEGVSRWNYAKSQTRKALWDNFGNNALTLNIVAGFTAMLASSLSLIGLYLGASSAELYWITNVLIMISCVTWYSASSPDKGLKKTWSEVLNQVAAVAQVLALSFMIATVYYFAPVMSYSDLSLTLVSGVSWLMSYCLPNKPKPQEAFRLTDEPATPYTNKFYLPVYAKSQPKPPGAEQLQVESQPLVESRYSWMYKNVKNTVASCVGRNEHPYVKLD